MGFWIRTGSVNYVNSQFSDNVVGATYPTSDCPGNTQLLHNSIFAGFTENVGSPGPKQNIFMSNGMGLWTSAPQLFVEGGHGQKLGWLQTADGVYRSHAKVGDAPMRGFNSYDNYAATFVYDTHFYDYPDEWERSNNGKKWFGSGIGVLLGNNFGMVGTPSKMWNLSFTNVARRAAFGSAPGEAPFPWFNAFGALDYNRQFLNDGEKNFMIFDEDGSISGSANTMIIAKENKPQIRGKIAFFRSILIIVDDCTWREDFNAYTCPKIHKYLGGRSGIITKKAHVDGSNQYNATENYFSEIQLNEREGEEGVFYVSSMGNAYTYAMYANHRFRSD